MAALTRRARGGLSPEDAAAALQRFRAEYADVFYVVGITPQVIADAMALAETHALRGYDAVQLAAALRVGGSSALLNISLIFVSADSELNAATIEGLVVDDPNRHP